MATAHHRKNRIARFIAVEAIALALLDRYLRAAGEAEQVAMRDLIVHQVKAISEDLAQLTADATERRILELSTEDALAIADEHIDAVTHG